MIFLHKHRQGEERERRCLPRAEVVTASDLGLLKEHPEPGALTLHRALGKGLPTCLQSEPWSPPSDVAVEPCCPCLPAGFCHSTQLWQSLPALALRGNWTGQSAKRKNIWYTPAVRMHSNAHTTQMRKYFVCWWKYHFLLYAWPASHNSEVKVGIIQGTGIT